MAKLLARNEQLWTFGQQLWNHLKKAEQQRISNGPGSQNERKLASDVLEKIRKIDGDLYERIWNDLLNNWNYPSYNSRPPIPDKNYFRYTKSG